MAVIGNEPKKLDKVPNSAVASIILLVSSLVWYLCFFSFLKNNSGFTGSPLVILLAINLIATILAAVMSTRIIQRIENRTKFIVHWLVIGVFLSILLLLINYSFFDFALIPNAIGFVPRIQFDPPSGVFFFEASIISCVIGLYCGLGFPVLMGYYTATTRSVNRAKISGLIIFLTSINYVSILLLVQNSITAVIALIVCKLCGLFAVLFLKHSVAKINKEKSVPFKNILKMRSLLLYLIPWLMFSIVNNFALPALDVSFGSDVINRITLLENLLAGIFAVIFGFTADRFGRKRVLLFGFTLLGLGYATLGLFPQSMNGLYFYTLADSVAWGIFTSLFLLTIWGDIADNDVAGKRDSEKFFVIGILPFVLSMFLQVLFGQFIADSVADLSRVFFFISIFLFIAVTPLYLAPETLSEKDKRDNEFKNYLKKAQKKVEKEANKKQRRKQAASVSDDSVCREKCES